jgi:hypothetical protein
MPRIESYLAELGSTKTQLAWHQPVPIVFGLLYRCEAPGCWYLGGPDGCMTRRQNLVEFLALATGAELDRSIKAGYLLTLDEAAHLQATRKPQAPPSPPVEARPTGRAAVRTRRVAPAFGTVPDASSPRELEAIGS